MSIWISYPGTDLKWECIPTIFPDKTSQVWHIPEIFLKIGGNVRISWYFEQEAEFIWLAQLVNLFDYYSMSPSLYIPYLPYGRQDKEIDNDSTFALRTFKRLLSFLDFKEIITEDRHSELHSDYYIGWDKSKISKAITSVVLEKNIDSLLYPDKGALSKYVKIMENLHIPYTSFNKNRDAATGRLVIDPIPDEYRHHYVDKKILIVDDICDGGATFIEASNMLYEVGAEEVHLYVSHGLFTKGQQVLFDAGIKSITTLEYEKP